MSNVFKATKYQLNLYKSQSLICLSIIALNILISVTVTHSFPKAGIKSGSSDLIVLIWIFIIGIFSFIHSFKFMLSNAVSRRSLFWANILSMSISSVTWAVIVTMLLTLINKLHIKIIVLYTLFYNDYSALGTIVWFCGAFFLLIVLGWFINMVYYRSSKRMVYVITLVPFIFAGLFIMVNQTTNGKLFGAISRFIVTAMGFSGSTPNPYLGSFSMGICALIICSFNYLLIRKVEIKG
jgi:hypothetical protein